jgi:hypothetical protein
VVESAAQVTQRDAPVHHQALDLVEDRHVGGVELVGADHLAGADDVDGQLPGQQ